MAANEKDFQHDFDAIRADISALADTVGKLASQRVNAAFGKATGKRSRRTGDDVWEGTNELGADMMGAAEHLITRNPARAVLIALGVGMVAALFALR
jgi:ElaB/YqjD/DUF883 family membrane-anchored ribosome-binding protein